ERRRPHSAAGRREARAAAAAPARRCARRHRAGRAAGRGGRAAPRARERRRAGQRFGGPIAVRASAYVVGIGVAAAAAGTAGYLAGRSPEARLDDHWSMIGQYCTDCHNDAEYTADLSLEGRSPEDIRANPGIWEEVVHKLTIGAMPPRDQPQPDPKIREQFVTALVSTLDAAAAAKPYAGTKTVHRLNRVEYANAIRDLLGVEANLASLLPSDGGDFGFDNIADVLRTSPMLLERYLTVALRVAD